MKKILMIEDEREILGFFEGFIHERLGGYAFLKTDNGNTGLQMAEKEKLAGVEDLLHMIQKVIPED